MNKIKISVIVPAYNVEKYIEKTLRSIMTQSLKEIEIIVINDGSKDKTLEVIKKLSVEDKRIIIVDKNNEGVSVARNEGILLSKGEYLSFIDGDDWIENLFLEDNYNYAKKNELDMVISDIFIDYKRRKVSKYHKEFQSNKIISGQEYINLYYNGQILRGICNKIIKKEIFIENNLFFLEKMKSGEDMNLTIKLGYICSKIGKMNKAYYHYIQYSQSVTKQKTSDKLYTFLESFNDIRSFIKRIDPKLLEREEKKIYKYEIGSIQSFVVRDSDWDNTDYQKAINIFFDLLKNKYFKESIKDFKYTYKILWLICYKYPNIKVFKILHYLFRWIEASKEILYRKIYL